jgi:hypothetical protein
VSLLAAMEANTEVFIRMAVRCDPTTPGSDKIQTD